MKCFTCGKPATHKSKGVSLAGYYDYQCGDHAIDHTFSWGSDPGFPVRTEYLPIEQRSAS